MWLITFTLKKMTNYLYFMIKIVFNFKCIYMYAWMHVLNALKKIILLIIYIFIIKILFNFKYIHAYAWSYMLVILNRYLKMLISV